MSKKKTSRQTRTATKQNMNQRAPVTTMDAFSNPAARIGFGTMDLLQATDYPMTRMTQNYQLLTSLYRENWIVQNIISTVPNDMIRKWYDIKTSIAPEYLKQMAQLERKIQLRKKLLLGMCWGRLYGGAVGVILIKGQNDMSIPLNLDTVMPGSFLGLHILDRWNGVYPEGELVTDSEDPDFGLPEYYTVRNDETGTMVAKVHHSRVIRFIGRELPWMEQVTEQYWGESEVEAIYEELIRRDNVAGNIAALTFRANINYQETDGLDQLLGSANAEIQRRFWNTLAAQSMMESNFGTRMINKGDAIQIKRMANLDIGATAAEWGNYGANLGSKLDNLDLDIGKLAGSFDDLDLSGVGGNNIDKVGKVGKVGKVEDIKLSDEDLKLYRNLAERRYMNRIELKTLAPHIEVLIPESEAKNLTAQDIADKLRVLLIEQRAAGTSVSHG